MRASTTFRLFLWFFVAVTKQIVQDGLKHKHILLRSWPRVILFSQAKALQRCFRSEVDTFLKKSTSSSAVFATLVCILHARSVM